MLNYFNFLAGIALMLLGIRSLRRGSERFFGARLRRLLQSATQNPLRSLVAGFLISILTPSSTAVALISVEAINAGYLHLPEVLALMLGANIGFTVTVQLLACPMTTGSAQLTDVEVARWVTACDLVSVLVL